MCAWGCFLFSIYLSFVLSVCLSVCLSFFLSFFFLSFFLSLSLSFYCSFVRLGIEVSWGFPEYISIETPICMRFLPCACRHMIWSDMHSGTLQNTIQPWKNEIRVLSPNKSRKIKQQEEEEEWKKQKTQGDDEKRRHVVVDLEETSNTVKVDRSLVKHTGTVTMCMLIHYTLLVWQLHNSVDVHTLHTLVWAWEWLHTNWFTMFGCLRLRETRWNVPGTTSRI